MYEEKLCSSKSLTKSYKGHCRFILNIETSAGYIHKVVSQDINVSPELDFIKSLREIVGEDNVWIET